MPFRIRHAALTACLVLATPQAIGYDWLQFNGDAAHSGNNRLEKRLTRNNVASLTQLFQVTLPATSDGAPVVLRRVQTSGGVRSLVFVTTTAGHIRAYDAITGAFVWGKQFTGSNFTTSSPAIDPNRQFVYSYGLDGYVHKLQVGDGTEVLTGGWPELATLKGSVEKGSSALSFATSQGVTYLYAANGGYPGDAGDYQGHVTAINLASGAQKVFNAMCSNRTVHLALNDALCASSRQTAVWARPGVIYDAGTDRIVFATGNSSNGGFTGNTGGFNWSESVLAIAPDGSGANGKPIDSYTPPNFQNLDNADADVGSTAPAVLPVPASTAVPHLAVQAGKDSQLRLLNLANLNGTGAPGATGGNVGAQLALPQGGVVLSQPAVWSNPADGSTWFFIANGNGIAGFKILFDGSGNPSMATQWSKTGGGTSPVIANNVLYYVSGGAVRALDPASGTLLKATASSGGTHWQSAVVANGVVYALDQSSHLTAYAPTSFAQDMDMDASGDSDLLWHDSATGGTGLWLMNGTSVASASGLMTDPNWNVTQVADLNGDDKADLIWYNAAVGTGAWLMNGTAPTTQTGLLSDPAWKVTQTADFNGDGKADLVWYNASTGGTGLWLMNGVTPIATTGLLTDPNWKVIATGDFNGDGKSDLVWYNAATGGTGIWLMNGATPLATAGILTAPGWQVVNVADFNGDGKSDLLWYHAPSGTTALWLMDGTTMIGSTGLLVSPDWRPTHVGDFNGDGRADILWRNFATGQTSMWLMDGTTMLAAGGLMSDPNFTVSSVGDLDGDGKADIIWYNATGYNVAWLMNGLTFANQAGYSIGSTWKVVNPR